MIPSRIHKVLSTTAAHQVQALLMGGQACVLYGGAEFSRDTDLLILAEAANLERLEAALQDLQAECIAVPPFEIDYLSRGHAIHFRCHHPEATDMRLDVMSVLRGVEAFPKLWERRTTLGKHGETPYEVLSLPDLVQAKKTQRDKDWVMLRRLLEAHFYQHKEEAREWHLHFWLQELRTPELLVSLGQAHADLAREMSAKRPLLSLAMLADVSGVANGLADEERQEREQDRTYWKPLRTELEKLRHGRLKN